MSAPDRYEQVSAALERLARGEFARCEICGAEIDDRRLRIAPDRTRCTTHVADPAPRR